MSTIRSSPRKRPRRRAGFAVAVLVTLIIVVVVGFRMRQPTTDVLVGEVYDAVRRGDFDSARRTLEQLHQQDPDDVEVVELLAETCLNAGDEAAAIDWLGQVPESSPERAVAAAFRGAQLSMQSHRASAARQCLDRCLRLDPDHVPARRMLMHLELVLARWEALAAHIAELDRRGQATPADVALLCVGRNYYWEDDSHLEWLEICVHTSPGDCLARSALAYYLAASSRRDEAVALLQNAGDSPTAFECWRIALTMAENEIDQGDFESAHNVLSCLPPEADASLRTWLAYARLFVEQNKPEAAIVAYTNASQLAPLDPEPVSAMARLLTRLQKHDEASRWARRAQLNSQLWQILSHAKPLAAQGPSATTVMEMGRLLQELGRHREAIICYGSLVDHPQYGAEATRLADLTRQNQNQEQHRYLSVVELQDLDRSISLAGIQSATISSEAAGAKANEDLPSTAIELSDIAADIGLDFTFFRGDSGVDFLPETLGGGIGVLDFDGDSWPDLFLTQGASLPVALSVTPPIADSNCVFRNVGGTLAVDVTAETGLVHGGYGQGCAVADMDNDGFPDLYVCNNGENLLYHNNGDGTFRDVTRQAGLHGQQWSTSASFADFDRDGDPDLYSVNYVHLTEEQMKLCRTGNYVGPCRVMDHPAEQDIFWSNQGDGRFQDDTTTAGVQAENGKGLGVVSADFDNDGWIDLFVGNDTTGNFLFRNLGTDTGAGTAATDVHASERSWAGFQEWGVPAGVAFNRDGKSEACMGIVCEDLNHDGLSDLFITNYELETNTFYANLGGLSFTDQSHEPGMSEASRPMLGWGAVLADLDADRDLDLFVANGHLYDPPMRSQLFLNNSGRFTEISDRAGTFFGAEKFGRSATAVDWNGDLAADVVVSDLKGRVALLQNNSPGGNRLSVRLIGTASARDSQGTRVSVTIGQQVRHFRSSADGGYFASAENDVKIGLGPHSHVDTLEVQWPSGRVQAWSQLAAGRKYALVENRHNSVVLRPAVNDSSP